MSREAGARREQVLRSTWLPTETTRIPARGSGRSARSVEPAGRTLKPGDTCYLREGRYTETIRLEGLKGTEDAPVIFTAFAGEKAVLDGSVPIASRWSHHGNGIYRTRLDRDVWQLFVDGSSACSARWPNGNWDDGVVRRRQQRLLGPLAQRKLGRRLPLGQVTVYGLARSLWPGPKKPGALSVPTATRP